MSASISESAPLFDARLLPSSVLAALPSGYQMRPLQRTDYHLGHLETLRALTTVGEISEQDWVANFDYMVGINQIRMLETNPSSSNSQGRGTYYVLVIVDDAGKIVGTGTLVVEQKFIHSLGLVGHIEDIVVREDQQGKKLGLRTIDALDHLAKQLGCYKTILDCSNTNEGFYVKCGYKRVGLEMAHYY